MDRSLARDAVVVLVAAALALFAMALSGVAATTTSTTTITIFVPETVTPDEVRHLCTALDETGSDSVDQVVLDTCRQATQLSAEPGPALIPPPPPG